MKTFENVQFSAKIHQPGGPDKGASWSFLRVPNEASQQFPTRSQIAVEGSFNGFPFLSVLDPDGEGGHWLKINQELLKATKSSVGDVVELNFGPASTEPEPEIPDDFQRALDAAPPKAIATWHATTPVARRDWVKWITSGKKEETRVKRIEVACSKLSNGNKRPCCFDRSGMYDKSMSCPIAEDE